MREFQNRHRRQRLMTSRPVQVFLLLILILLGPSIVRLYERERAVAGEAPSFRQELAALTARRAELLTDIARLTTERGVEEEIRERFGVVKEGEKVINLLGSPLAITATATLPWWRKIFDWFE